MKNLYLLRILLKFILKGSFDDKSVLVQIMTWRRTGDRPLPEAMLTQFNDEYTRGTRGNELISMINMKHKPLRACVSSRHCTMEYRACFVGYYGLFPYKYGPVSLLWGQRLFCFESLLRRKTYVGFRICQCNFDVIAYAKLNNHITIRKLIIVAHYMFGTFWIYS